MIYSITKFRRRVFSPFVYFVHEIQKCLFRQFHIQVPVVQTLGSIFQRISYYPNPADKYWGKQLPDPLDRDLPSRY